LGQGIVAEKMLSTNKMLTKILSAFDREADSIAGTQSHSQPGINQNTQRKPLDTPP
jgi:hypothetical protein